MRFTPASMAAFRSTWVPLTLMSWYFRGFFRDSGTEIAAA